MVPSQKTLVTFYLWCGSIFSYFITFFPYSDRLCFSFSARLLYLSRQYCFGFSFLLQKDLDSFCKHFFKGHIFVFLWYLADKTLYILAYEKTFLYKTLVLKNVLNFFILLLLSIFYVAYTAHKVMDLWIIWKSNITWKLLEIVLKIISVNTIYGIIINFFQKIFE